VSSHVIAIIGGGIAGLAAAYELAQRQTPFVLLEASDRLGGLIFTEHIGGYTIECGADSMLAQKPSAIALCEELGLASRLMPTTPPRTAYVHARDRLFPIPSPSVMGIPTTPEGIAGYALLPEPVRQTLADRIASDIPGAQGDESVADFFRRRFGPETVSLIAEPLLGGIHAGNVELLSIAAVAPRLAAADARSGGLRRILSDATAASLGDGLFRSLPQGMGELVSAVIDRLPKHSIRLRTEAVGLERIGSDWIVRTRDDTIPAAGVIMAAPAYAAAEMLGQAAPAIAAICAEMPYVSTASVALSWPRSAVSHPLDGSGFVVARQHSRLRITACSWVTSKWAGRAPDGMILLRAFLGGAPDPDVVTLQDDELIEIASRDIASVLQVERLLALARVHRWIRAGAQHNVGHLARMTRLEGLLTESPGLFVAGSGFRAIGVPDCIADGRAAASAASDYAKIRT
jgi:oxygen-dependent protoporphyrinogen oxidase